VQPDTAWKQLLYEAIGERVRERRSEASLTLRFVAAKIGVPFTKVARVEEGQSVDLAFLVKFAQLVGCSLNDLVPPVPVTFNHVIEKE
jgi:transcriptional regulator with XRE-family HTH domain